MILSREHLMQAIVIGDIVVSPFNPDLVAEHSIDVRLGNRMFHFDHLGTAGVNPYTDNPDDWFEEVPLEGARGFFLKGGEHYLGVTHEVIGARRKYVPQIKAKSTTGRWGLTVALCAGFGEIGYVTQWTLEIRPVSNIFLAPMTPIAQIFFSETTDTQVNYQGDDRYFNTDGETRILPKNMKVVP